jgi:hypothetical protein
VHLKTIKRTRYRLGESGPGAARVKIHHARRTLGIRLKNAGLANTRASRSRNGIKICVVGAPTFALVHRVRDVVEVDVERPEHPGPTPRVLVGGPAKGVDSDQRLHSGAHMRLPLDRHVQRQTERPSSECERRCASRPPPHSPFCRRRALLAAVRSRIGRSHTSAERSSASSFRSAACGMRHTLAFGMQNDVRSDDLKLERQFVQGRQIFIDMHFMLLFSSLSSKTIA